MPSQEKKVDRAKIAKAAKELRDQLKKQRDEKEAMLYQLPIELAYMAMGMKSEVECKRFKIKLRELSNSTKDIELALEGLGRLEAGI